MVDFSKTRRYFSDEMVFTFMSTVLKTPMYKQLEEIREFGSDILYLSSKYHRKLPFQCLFLDTEKDHFSKTSRWCYLTEEMGITIMSSVLKTPM